MKRFFWYGWLGLATLVPAEVLMLQRVQPIWQWFTPIMWSGYIILADMLVLRLRGASLLHDRPREFVLRRPETDAMIDARVADCQQASREGVNRLNAD